jgi:DNA-directed RNA polymerase
LLKFAHGEPLGNEGRYWLAVHGANTFGNDKVSFNERVAFIEDKTEEIKLIALDALKMRHAWCPMDDKGKCTVDDPWGYLAFCFEWAKMSNMSDHTKFVSHLPVKLDATCSGLQHFSAMLRDEFGATATNVGDNTTRNDIYTLAGDATKKAIENELVCIILPEEKQLKRSFIPVLNNRKIPKNPCMTLPYGVSTFGITDKLIEQAEEGLLDEAYVDSKSNSKEKLGHYRWFAQKLEEGVSTVVPSAVEAMDWLKKCDKVLSKSLQPSEYYEFISPIGLPVKQCSLKQNVKRVAGFFGVEKIRIRFDVRSSVDQINRAKSQTSIAPNFVHAQDASHLCNVAVRVRQELGLKSCSFIHDSFGVHPSETSAFLRVIKEEFHKLYTGDRLNEVKEYWEETYKVELPAPPTQGKFNIDSILDSVFIFS